MQRHHHLFKRITIDHEMCFGKPFISRMRLPLASKLDYLSSGLTTDEFLVQFSFLEKEDNNEALAFSALINA